MVGKIVAASGEENYVPRAGSWVGAGPSSSPVAYSVDIYVVTPA